jgi:regulation of enolase protein 1 (concanavalin A-like superfamily)
MKLLYTLLLAGSLATSQAQSISESTLNSEFTSTDELKNWKWLHDTEGWPNKIRNQNIKDGVLTLEAGTSGWFADKNAPFLYKEVKGDFDVRTRIKATGLSTDRSQTIWSLGGLMVRVPKRTDKTQWKPKEENWMFITTGIAEEPGKQVIETKYTLNSKSNLKLRDAKAEWITLRVTRVGNAFIMLYKYDADKDWTVHDRFYLVDWPPILQVGLNCYTNSMAVPGNILWGDPFKFNNEIFDHLGKPDFKIAIDFVRFSKPLVNYDAAQQGQQWLNQVYTNRLVDYNLSNKELAKMLGD